MSGYIGNIPVPEATQTRDVFTATLGQTTFSTSGYTPNYLDVYLNGVHLDPADYTASNGTDVVLATGADAGDSVIVVAWTTFSPANVTVADISDLTATATELNYVDGVTSNIQTQIDNISTDVVSDTTPQLGGNLDTNGNDVTFGDNDKAIFGAGSDLQIYHDGSNSYVQDSGTGHLRLGGTNLQLMNGALTEYYFSANENGTVKLYYDNAEKLATTSTGVSITGEVAATSFTGDGSSLTGIEGVPSGVICMWGGLVANIPSGWYLCDGSNGTPNLSGKFIKGTTGNPGGTGGSSSTDSTTLSTAQMPSHNHTIPASRDWNNGSNNVVQWTTSGIYAVSGNVTASTGGGGSHSHSFEPPYYSLCYIQKA